MPYHVRPLRGRDHLRYGLETLTESEQETVNHDSALLFEADRAVDQGLSER